MRGSEEFGQNGILGQAPKAASRNYSRYPAGTLFSAPLRGTQSSPSLRGISTFTTGIKFLNLMYADCLMPIQTRR